MSNAIISLKPRHSANVLKGEKTVEIRNRPVNLQPGTRLWIYSTLPRGCLEAVAVVSKVYRDSPNVIWKKYSKDMAISKEEYRAYVSSSIIVSAIVIDKVIKIDPVVSLRRLQLDAEGFHPPQFFKRLLLGTPLLEYLHSLLEVDDNSQLENSSV